MRIIFLPEALDYFNELSTILFEKNYFGFEKDALEYVDDFVNDIKTTLPNRQKRLAPSYFERYGKDMHYATFKKNKQTQWYVFFTVYEHQGEFIYVVRYISNNHLIAQLL